MYCSVGAGAACNRPSTVNRILSNPFVTVAGSQPAVSFGTDAPRVVPDGLGEEVGERLNLKAEDKP